MKNKALKTITKKTRKFSTHNLSTSDRMYSQFIKDIFMLKTIVKEPLLQFLIIGVVVFSLVSVMSESNEPDNLTINVSPAQIERWKAVFEQQRLRPPTETEVTELIDDHIREEILYREAIAMGLEKDDTVVRRRMVHKIRFVTEGLFTFEEPEEEKLTHYIEEHAARYRIPDQITFSQVYFNVSKENATKAAATLKTLNSMDTFTKEQLKELGDPIFVDSKFQDVSIKEVSKTFGIAFSEGINNLTTGEWHGPLQSGLGLHLVKVDKVTEMPLPQASEIKDRVLADYKQEQFKKLNESFYEDLKSRYEITIADIETKQEDNQNKPTESAEAQKADIKKTNSSQNMASTVVTK